MNLLAGNACAITLTACPLPQPISATSTPRAAGPAGRRREAGRRRRVRRRTPSPLVSAISFVEARVGAVGQAAAVAEAADDLLLDLAQQRDELRDAGEVVGARRRASAPPRIRAAAKYVEVAASKSTTVTGHHPAKPLAYIALVEACSIGDLGAGGRRQVGHRVEQPGLMADGQQDGDAGAVDRSDDPFGELCQLSS